MDALLPCARVRCNVELRPRGLMSACTHALHGLVRFGYMGASGSISPTLCNGGKDRFSFVVHPILKNQRQLGCRLWGIANLVPHQEADTSGRDQSLEFTATCCF